MITMILSPFSLERAEASSDLHESVVKTEQRRKFILEIPRESQGSIQGPLTFEEVFGTLKGYSKKISLCLEKGEKANAVEIKMLFLPDRKGRFEAASPKLDEATERCLNMAMSSMFLPPPRGGQELSVSFKMLSEDVYNKKKDKENKDNLERERIKTEIKEKCSTYSSAIPIKVERKITSQTWLVSYGFDSLVLRTKNQDVFPGPGVLGMGICPGSKSFSCWVKTSGTTTIESTDDERKRTFSLPLIVEVSEKEVADKGCTN